MPDSIEKEACQHRLSSRLRRASERTQKRERRTPLSAPVRKWIPVVVIAVAVGAPIAGNLHDHGQLLEEGFMIFLPHQVLHGSAIYRDFHWYWGPAGLWIPAVIHSAAGWSEATFRFIGVGYVAAAAVAGYGIARRWSTLGG